MAFSFNSVTFTTGKFIEINFDIFAHLKNFTCTKTF